MAESTPRPLLPHVSHPLGAMSANSERREQQRSYVFVDEQTRHRRLKVVRACDGCRKRKIRCDSANTNNWPCSACIRLKMTCVPPSLSYDDEDAFEPDFASQSSFLERSVPQQHGGQSPYNYIPQPYPLINPFDGSPIPSQSQRQIFQPARNPPAVPTTTPTSRTQNALRYNSIDSGFNSLSSPRTPRSSQNYTLATATASTSTEESASSAEVDQLVNNFVGLNVGDDGRAKYIPTAQKNAGPVQGVPNEEVALPQNIGSNAQIPPDWMPNDNQATQYFQYFFEHIHPYVPVLNAPHFYRLWNSNKQSISPLVLEAIFACSALALHHTIEGNRWLALAARHEENFKDSPRLSTIQGMLLLMKAREAVPRQGYYFRSWMTIVNLVAMAKDLELDQHYELHQSSPDCDSDSPEECVTKTRVWHVLFAIELLVGGPQGRTNFGVALDTVDFDGDLPLPGLDEHELQISQDFIPFLRCIRNIRTSNLLHHKLSRKNDEWAGEPKFVEHNIDFDDWSVGLPIHLNITYAPEGAAPWIRSHFVAHLHAYHNLSILMHFGPQLVLASKTMRSSWKSLMARCLLASKSICRLQEGIFRDSGLSGLLHMVRGVNFHIYAILTSVNIHLVALTSPDPEVHGEAPDYFTRHMRLLEICSSAWPMPEVQHNIESLRQAFSADLNKPFELNSYVYGSPKRQDSISPPPTEEYQGHNGNHTIETGYNSFPMSPPNHNGRTMSADYGSAQSGMMAVGSQAHFGPATQMLPTAQGVPEWNPSRIFEQWHTAFIDPQIPPVAQTPTSLTIASPTGSYMSQQHENGYPTFTQNITDITTMTDYVPQMQSPQQHIPVSQAYMPPQHAYITPIMWRDTLASASSAGIKRRWQVGAAGSSNGISKRTR